MSTDIETEIVTKIVSDWSESDGILIKVNMRDGMVTEIRFKITDEMESKPLEFMLPHSNNLNSLKALRDQIDEILASIENASAQG